jgi:hypothetical protein
MTFHERAWMLKDLANAIMARKEELYELNYPPAPPATTAGSTSRAALGRSSPSRPRAAASFPTSGS